MSSNTNTINLFNAIRLDSSDDFRNDVPEMKVGDSISKFAEPVLNYEAHTNEFINTLINRIAFTIVENKMYHNRLSVLKKGRKMPLGTDVQHIYTNPINPMGYDGDNLSGILSQYKTDTKVAYYKRNRQDVFPLTINRQELQGAFVSWEAFNDFLSGKVNAVYSGNEIREYNLFKESIVESYNNGVLLGKKIPAKSTDDRAKSITAEIKEMMMNMQFPSTQYNNYINLEGSTGEPVKTWVNPENIVILMRSDVIADLSVKVLASAFNISEVDFRDRIIPVDTFDYDEYDLNTRKVVGKVKSNIAFVVCDEAVFQVYDNIETACSDFIGSSLSWQYFFHIWQTYGICPFADCVVYEFEESSEIESAEFEDNSMITLDYKGVEETEKTISIKPTDTEIKDISIEFVSFLIKVNDKITEETLNKYVKVKIDETDNKKLIFYVDKTVTPALTEDENAFIVNTIINGYKIESVITF